MSFSLLRGGLFIVLACLPLRHGFSQETVEACLERGDLDLRRYDYAAALADYNHAVELDPKNVFAYSGRSRVKEALGDFEGAMSDCDEVLKINSRYFWANSLHGLLKARSGKVDEGLADLDRLIENHPKDAFAYNARGWVKENLRGDLEGAIADQNRAIDLRPRYAKSYTDRGMAQLRAGHWREALADFHQFNELSQEQDYQHLFMWIAREKLGERAAANQELANYLLLRQAHNSGDWYAKLAGHLLGTVSEADLVGAAQSTNSEQQRCQTCEAWYYVGIKQLLAGDQTTAAASFRKALETKKTDFVEYQCAEAELKTLKPAGAAEQPPG